MKEMVMGLRCWINKGTEGQSKYEDPLIFLLLGLPVLNFIDDAKLFHILGGFILIIHE